MDDSSKEIWISRQSTYIQEQYRTIEKGIGNETGGLGGSGQEERYTNNVG